MRKMNMIMTRSLTSILSLGGKETTMCHCDPAECGRSNLINEIATAFGLATFGIATIACPPIRARSRPFGADGDLAMTIFRQTMQVVG